MDPLGTQSTASAEEKHHTNIQNMTERVSSQYFYQIPSSVQIILISCRTVRDDWRYFPDFITDMERIRSELCVKF
jgi:hypothetical protein